MNEIVEIGEMKNEQNAKVNDDNRNRKRIKIDEF